MQEGRHTGRGDYRPVRRSHRNRGDRDIVVDVYANVTGGAYNYTLETAAASNEIVEVDVSFQATPLQSGQEVAIKVYSRRQNNAYDKYTVQ